MAADVHSDDYYKVLGVPRDAEVEQIKKSYKKLAMKYHPDKNPNDAKAEETFKKVSEAYSVLGDKEKRQTYDQFGKAGMQGGVPMPGGFPGGAGGGAHMSQEDAARLFAQMFGGDDPFAAFFGGMGGGGGRRGGRGGMPGGIRFTTMGGSGGEPFDFGGFGGMPMGGMGGMGGDPFGGMGGMHRGRSHGRHEGPASGEIPPGTHVLLKGLRSAKHLNGEMGVVAGYDPVSQRYIIHLDDEEEDKKFKRENIQQIIEGVEVFGLKQSPELNGSMGTLFDRNSDTDRYNVRVERAHKTLALQPGNVILPMQTCVIIVGLTKGTHFNGRAGTITQVDRGNERYVVELGSGEHVRVRWENVRA